MPNHATKEFFTPRIVRWNSGTWKNIVCRWETRKARPQTASSKVENLCQPRVDWRRSDSSFQLFGLEAFEIQVETLTTHTKFTEPPPRCGLSAKPFHEGVCVASRRYRRNGYVYIFTSNEKKRNVSLKREKNYLRKLRPAKIFLVILAAWRVSKYINKNQT